MTRAKSRSGLAERLAVAIRTACEARGDSEINIALLITASREFDADSQRDLAEHFEEVAREWASVAEEKRPWGGGESSKDATRKPGL